MILNGITTYEQGQNHIKTGQGVGRDSAAYPPTPWVVRIRLQIVKRIRDLALVFRCPGPAILAYISRS